MAISKFFTIAYRNLARNGRRTILTAMAIALGLVVVLAMSSMIEGMVDSMVADGIRVTTGHLQIRKDGYETSKASLLSQDLLRDGESLAAQVEALPGVQSAAPVLWAGGLLSTTSESVGVEIVGLDTDDAFHDPIRTGITTGNFLANDDRGQILLGRYLASEMDISIGQRVSLAAGNADGEGQEGIFTVVGFFDTGFPGLDQGRVIMPLAQAQSFLGVGDRFSSMIVMLNNQEDAVTTASSIAGPDLQILTWQEMNSLIIDTVQNGIVFYYIIYAIVFIAVAILIANTLLMSVFARAREIGILASLGMSRSEITLLFLIEASLLALFGIAIGLVLGLGAVAYMTYVGLSIPVDTVALVEGFAMGTTLYGGFAPGQFIVLSLMLLIIVILVSLYPARYAARLEPVEALHSAV